MSINISNDVKNFGNAPGIETGNFSNLPLPGINGRLYFAVDTQQVFIDNGTSWVIVVAGTGGGGGGYSVSPNYYALANAFGVLNNGSITENATTIAINGLGKQIYIDSDTNFTVDVIGDKASSCNNEEKIINDTLVYSALYANIDGVYAILLQSSLASVNILAQQDITVEANDGVLVSGKNGPVVIKTLAGFSQDIEINSNNTYYVYALESIETITGLKEITANSLGFYSNSTIDLASGTPINLTSDNGSIFLYANDPTGDVILQAGDSITAYSNQVFITALTNCYMQSSGPLTLFAQGSANLVSSYGGVYVTGENSSVNINTLPASGQNINIDADNELNEFGNTVYVDADNQLSLFGAPIALESNSNITLISNNNTTIESTYGNLTLQTAYGGLAINNNSTFSNLTFYSARETVLLSQLATLITALNNDITIQTTNGKVNLKSTSIVGGGIDLNSSTVLDLISTGNLGITTQAVLNILATLGYNLTVNFGNAVLQTNNGSLSLQSTGFMGGVVISSATGISSISSQDNVIESTNASVFIDALNNVEITGNSRVDISAGYDAVHIFGVKGMVLPRKYNADILAISSPIIGSMIYNIDLECPVFFNNSGWQQVNYSAM